MLEWLKAILGTAYNAEIDAAVASEIGKGFVAKGDFNAKVAELTQAKDAVKERDGQLETLKNATGAVDGLKKQIAELQAANVGKEKEYQTELLKVRRGALDERMLLEAKAINPLACKPFLGDIDFTVADDGYVALRKQQIEALAKAESTKFLFSAAEPKLTGFKPGEAGDGSPPPGGLKGNPFDPKTYDEAAQVRLFREQPEAARAMARAAGLPIL